MTSRKSRQARKRKFTRHPIDRTAPRARFARSESTIVDSPAIRDPQPFQPAAINAADQAFIDEQLRMADELLTGDVDDER